MAKSQTLLIEGTEIVLHTRESDFYVNITDIARHRSEQQAGELVRNWLRARSTVDFLGAWEKQFNPRFNYIGFDTIRMESGSNDFLLSVKDWIAQTHAVGLEARPGRYGGTFGHLYIALHFANWMNVNFYLKFIDGYVKMIAQLNPALDVQRLISRANFHLHTASVRENLVPLLDWHTGREAYFQASEADLLNLVVFGTTARAWKTANPEKNGNLRDHASRLELLVLSNLEAINAMLIEEGMRREERTEKLLRVAASEFQTLSSVKSIEELKRI